MRFLLKALAVAFVLGLAGACTSYASDLVLVGAKIYPLPTDPPIEHGSIVIRDGRIAAVGPSSDITVPPGAKVIDCTGLVVTAGFWNSHVHILTPGLIHAEKLSPNETTTQLQAMLTQWGFTTVFDVASVLENTKVVRNRISNGQTTGPRILTVGEPFWSKTPIYVKSFLETNHINIPEVLSAEEARQRVQREVREGADGIKIFVNSVQQDTSLTMPVDLVKVIVEEAHALHKPVFAHVSNDKGIEVALQSGVDILTHTTPTDELWTPAFAQHLVAAHVALTPTLTLWEVESRKSNISAAALEEGMSRAAEQLGAFLHAGGDVLFGTDVGYIDQFNTSEEFKWMSRGGMSYQQILASLTSNPARRFGFSGHSGRIEKGFDADLVVLRTDPAQDVTAFSKVRYTIRNGMVIYSSPTSP